MHERKISQGHGCWWYTDDESHVYVALPGTLMHGIELLMNPIEDFFGEGLQFRVNWIHQTFFPFLSIDLFDSMALIVCISVFVSSTYLFL